jgi:DNA-directed RNA polymerase subunit RPC12/RpoP
MKKAGQMFDDLEGWYDEHLDASFGEIEAEARKQRRELMGEAMGVLINGRDTGMQVEVPRCAKCGQAMEFEGYRRWGVHGLEGDTELERALYVCPECEGETIFPPGSETSTASRSLECRGGAGGRAARVAGEVI